MGEHGRNVIEGACQGGMERKQTHIATTHAEMSDLIKANIRKSDILFMKGSRKAALDKVVEGISEYFGLRKGLKNAI